MKRIDMFELFRVGAEVGVRVVAFEYTVFSPEAGVTAVAALGGHGMTLSFGLAEQIVGELIQ
jgi:hypothetical protein